MMNGGPNHRVEIVLIEEDSGVSDETVKSLSKANIANRVHTLHEPQSVLDFLVRAGTYADQPPLPAETLILLSLSFRQMHGLDVLKKIRSDERTRSLPVIMLTSSQEERGVMQSYKLGANACMVKPLDLPKLMEAAAELKLSWLLVSSEES
jgi:two-component system response regulator